MKTAKQLREEIAQLNEEVEAICAVAGSEERDLLDDEKNRIDAIQGKGDVPGEIDLLAEDLRRIDQIEQRKKAMAASRFEIKGADEPELIKKVPASAKAHGNLKAFKNADDAYQAGQFFMAVNGDNRAKEWCRQNGVEIRAAMGGTDNEKGGFTVPEPMESSIIRLVEEYGVFRQYARPYPMASDSATVPRRTDGFTVYYPDENSEITDSDLTFGNVSLTAKKMAILTRVSSELSEDTIIQLADLLATEMAWSFANAEDNNGFNGDGTSTYGGVVGLANALAAGSIKDAESGNNNLDNLDLKDFENTIAKCPYYAGAMPAWFISKQAWAASMQRLADAAGGNTTETIADGASQTMFLGYPVVFTQVLQKPSASHASTIVAYFGDLSLSSTLGTRRGVSIATDGSRYFEYDQIAVRGTQRVAINNHEVGDASNAGPVVALKTAA